MEGIEAAIEETPGSVGGFTYACRILCTALIGWPLLYGLTVDEGDVYLFLILVLTAGAAGLVLMVNSVFCLVRHRGRKSTAYSLAFTLIGCAGLVVAWYYLPLFAMH